MKLLKIALFAFICFVVLLIASGLTGLLIFGALGLLAAVISFASLVAWICAKMFRKFRYSLNVILIFIFSILTLTTTVFGGTTSQLETYEDILNLSPISIAWVLSVTVLVVSILVLVGRVIFTSKKIDENINMIDVNTDVFDNAHNDDSSMKN